MPNKHLNILNGVANKNDEFYTLYRTVASIVESVPSNRFKNKTIYCPCDPLTSNFTQYFITNFQRLKLKKLICTSYNTKYQIFIKTKKLEKRLKCLKLFNDILNNNHLLIKTPPNGSFLSTEFKKYWQEADYIITNPPFSKIEKFLNLINKYHKYYMLIVPVLLCYKTYFRKNINKIYAIKCQDKFIKPNNSLEAQPCVAINNFYNFHKYRTYEYKKHNIFYKEPVNRFWELDPTFYKIIKFIRPRHTEFSKIITRRKYHIVPK